MHGRGQSEELDEWVGEEKVMRPGEMA
jgi:hypothetical protein